MGTVQRDAELLEPGGDNEAGGREAMRDAFSLLEGRWKELQAVAAEKRHLLEVWLSSFLLRYRTFFTDIPYYYYYY